VVTNYSEPAPQAVSVGPAALMRWLSAVVLIGAISLSAGHAQARAAPESFADLVDGLLPGVVNISTTQSVAAGPEIPQFPPGSPFEEFFKEFFERQGPQDRTRQATSLGSGFIIDPDGYIVTNNHVIEDADEITVILQDESELPAEIIGIDPKTDLALLKVEVDEPLDALEWGDSSVVRVGDWVVAIGNPFGLGGTVTAGIVSARQRDINAGPYDDFLQTDASINRGNSGGPMFNMDGKIIGINTAIFSPSGGSIGIGFAIPSNLARNVITQLQEFGETRRGWLGVRIQTVTDDIAQSLGLDETQGALVASVTPDSPAEDAGLAQGDVILEFDGRAVTEMRNLPRIVAETPIDETVDVVIWRKGGRETVSVTIGQLDESDIQTASVTSSTVTEEESLEALGLQLTRVTDEMRLRFDLGEDVRGVLVLDVDVGSPAEEKGLQPGDLIIEVGQEPVASPGDVADKVQAAKEAGRKSVLLLVQRVDDLRFVAVRIGDS